jgi:hypothetical protein
MNTVELFYKPPKDESFNELREVCIKFWNTFFSDDEDYRDEKIGRIMDLPNTGSNFISMVQMIHPVSHEVIAKSLSLETRNAISMRLHGWETEKEFDFFNIWNINNNLDL